MSARAYASDGPAVLSFSGGRTSGYLLAHALEHGFAGSVVFANTGLEDEATLRFVRDCAQWWQVPVTWLEYRTGRQFVEVSFETASRNGEPFSALIDERKFLPNPVARFCTSELKVRTVERWAATQKLLADGFESWLGIRADESSRVSRLRARAGRDGGLGEVRLPLADAGVSVADVHAFWAGQPFGLQLVSDGKRTFAGNCSLCFMKPAKQIVSLIRERPERAVWWIGAESGAAAWTDGRGATFRANRPAYRDLAVAAVATADLFPEDEALIDCFCGDDA